MAVGGERKDTCAVPVCGPRQKISQEGECIECGAFEKVSEDKKTCETPTCGERQKISAEGVCEDCEPHTIL